MSDTEVALELFKILTTKCLETAQAVQKKESFLQLYRECLETVRDKS